MARWRDAPTAEPEPMPERLTRFRPLEWLDMTEPAPDLLGVDLEDWAMGRAARAAVRWSSARHRWLHGRDWLDAWRPPVGR